MVFLISVSGLFLNDIPAVLAFRTEQLEIEPRGNFDIGPTQFAIDAAPGETVTRELQLTSAKAEEWDYEVSVEDFEGSNDPEQTVLLQGDKSGRYGARSWFQLEQNSFKLKSGERVFFNVTIKVPENADAGDHYASVLIKALPKSSPEQKDQTTAPNVQIVSRAGVLFFINVNGAIKQSGELKKFTVDKKKAAGLPIKFNTEFVNDGTVRLQPAGVIEIKNQFGAIVKTIDVEPFNVLRNSTRGMSYLWEDGGRFLVGKYTATLKLNRGYKDEVDLKSVTFWILPMKKLALAGGIILLILIVGIVVGRKFKITLKLRKEN